MWAWWIYTVIGLGLLVVLYDTRGVTFKTPEQKILSLIFFWPFFVGMRVREWLDSEEE